MGSKLLDISLDDFFIYCEKQRQQKQKLRIRATLNYKPSAQQKKKTHQQNEKHLLNGRKYF